MLFWNHCGVFGGGQRALALRRRGNWQGNELAGEFVSRHIPLPEYLNDPAKGAAGAVLLLDD
jgi:hypothetical protein